MIDSTHIDAAAEAGVLVIRLKCEKIAEYEATIVETEINGLCPGFHHKIALDFTQVQMLASVGLGMLTSLNRVCRTNKGKLALFALNDNLRHLMRLTRLDSAFIIVPDRAAAVKAIT